eukprot:3570548-Amphidinium_carterae.2
MGKSLKWRQGLPMMLGLTLAKTLDISFARSTCKEQCSRCRSNGYCLIQSQHGLTMQLSAWFRCIAPFVFWVATASRLQVPKAEFGCTIHAEQMAHFVA